ncbi:hypothetical protein R80B4_00788 [Fibrobacteres bacterium R8-0-B4]
MKNIYFALTAALLTAALITCENVPEFCGTGELYDPNCAFCYGSQPYIFCENDKREYNPLIQGCVPTTKMIGTRCANDSVVTTGTPCGGYTLTTAVTPENGGALITIGGRTKYSADEEAVLSATPYPEYEFAGWAGAQPAGNYAGATYKMTGPNAQVTIVAMFRPKLPGKLITDVFPNNAGTITRNPNKETYEEGETVTVTATPAPNSGYAFDGWSGAGVPDNARNPLTLTMTESKTLVAIFTPAVRTLKATVSPAGSGAVYIDNTAMTTEYQEVGTTVNVWARHYEGYAFSQWTWTGDVSFGNPDSANTSVTLGAGAEITAHFVKGGSGTVAPPTEMKYTVEIISAGTGATGGGSYAAGAAVGISAGNAPSGQRFKNWTTSSNGVSFADANNAATTFRMPPNTVTVTANFIPNDTGGGDTVVTPPDSNVIVGNNNCTSAETCNPKPMPDGKVWMTENLNIQTETGSWCYDDAPANCDKYGRLYTWDVAMSACPRGWHLSTRAEWDSLALAVGGIKAYSSESDNHYWDNAGWRLKSVTGWTGYSGMGNNNTYGFSALPGGGRYTSGSFDYAGSIGHWWTAAENSSGIAYYRGMGSYDVGVGEDNGSKDYGFSVRCVEGDGGTPTPVYTVTVSSAGSGATGSGSYAAGATVNISVGTAPSGQTFKNWTATGVTLPNANSAATSFIMPSNAVTVTANFEAAGTTPTDTNGFVTIGGKKWMKKNLNIETADSWCYGNSPDSCAKYGRLYTWSAAKTVCPSGWHLPSRDEWGTLAKATGGNGDFGIGGTAGNALKSTSGWNENGNGTDTYGFSALPGGYRFTGGTFNLAGYNGYWWMATEYGSDIAYYRYMDYYDDYVGEDYDLKDYAFSVRCVGDD